MKVLLLNSGGKDALAVAMLLHKEHELHSLYVDVGQPTALAEEHVARKVAAKYCASHEVFRGGPRHYVARAYGGYLITPNKTVVFHVLGAMHARTVGLDAIASGQRSDVQPEDFPARYAALFDMTTPTWKQPLPFLFPLHAAPFHEPGRSASVESEIVFDFIKSEPLWRETICCLRDPACGTCPRCRLRQEWMARP